jgi:lysozyme
MNLAQQLRQEENAVPHAYQDHLGFWTIGVGRLIDRRKGGGLSPEEIDLLLDNDIRRCSAEVFRALPWAQDLNEARQAVLIGMAFQMGLSGLLGFRNALAHAKAGRFSQATAALLDRQWAQQTPGRAARMARQMETGQWQTRPDGGR